MKRDQSQLGGDEEHFFATRQGDKTTIINFMERATFVAPAGELSLLEKQKRIYDMAKLKLHAADSRRLAAFRTRNLYIVMNSNLWIARAPIVHTWGGVRVCVDCFVALLAEETDP